MRWKLFKTGTNFAATLRKGDVFKRSWNKQLAHYQVISSPLIDTSGFIVEVKRLTSSRYNFHTRELVFSPKDTVYVIKRSSYGHSNQ